MSKLSKLIKKAKRWIKKQQQKYDEEQKPPVVVPDTPVPPNNPVIPNNLPLLCGTEFVEINDYNTLDWMASCGLNYCRIHGSRIALGGNNYERMWLMEWKGGKMRYNMDHVDPVFIVKLQRFVTRALDLGIYVCVSEPNSSESKAELSCWCGFMSRYSCDEFLIKENGEENNFYMTIYGNKAELFCMDCKSNRFASVRSIKYWGQ